MNKLDGFIAYLSGPIEAMPCHGAKWRKEFIYNTWYKKKINIEFIDPTDKGDKEFEEIGDERKKIKHFKESNQYDKVRDFIKKVRRFDLRAIDKCDFVIAAIDKNIPTVGTYDEVILAERQNKPVLGIINGGPNNCPDWLYGSIKPKEMFFDMEECLDYLYQVNSGKISMDNRWLKIETKKRDYNITKEIIHGTS